MGSQLRDKPGRHAAARTTAARGTTRTRKARATASHGPTHEEIALRAHALYAQSGYVHGRDQEFWLEAERQLLAERNA